jgi:16S rRNA (guanine527-N7)-methyltransferase
MKNNFTSLDLQKALSISDSVMEKMRVYVTMLEQWNTRMNLVSASTMDNVWHRHVYDSAQIIQQIPKNAQTLADLGSGAGFPGMIIAMMTGLQVTLIERDTKKAEFLREVALNTDTDVEVLQQTIEEIKGRTFDVITSRALAELSLLFRLAQSLSKPSTTCLFLKGKMLDQELTKAQKEWGKHKLLMDIKRVPSVTSDEGTILCLSQIRKMR